MSSNKQFPPSQRKIKKAQERGDIAKSTKLSGLVVLAILMVISINFLIPFSNILEIQKKIFTVEQDFNTNSMLLFGREVARLVGFFCFKLFFCSSVFVVLVECAQACPRFIWDRVFPKTQRLNVVENFNRVIAGTSQGFDFWSSMFGCLARIVFALLAIPALVVCRVWPKLSIGNSMLEFELDRVIAYLKDCTTDLCASFAILLVGYGVFDYAIQRHVWKKRLRMDRDELRNEFRETEGSPEIINMRKYLHQEILQNDIIQNVRRANVLVVNK